MKNTMKKILFFLTAVMLFVAVALTASAAETIDSGTCGENLTWTLDSAGTLNISGTGNMYGYSIYFEGRYAPWYDNRDLIKKVLIENGVKSIGMYSFYDCDFLTEIVVADSVTTISGYAIMDCPALVSVTFGENSSLTTIGECSIYECAALPEIRIPGSVTSIGNTPFAFCTAMKNITVDEGNAVYSSENGVLYNKNKTTLVCYPAGKTNTSFTVPDTVSAFSIAAFGGCCNLETVVLPDNLETIESALFSHCESLQNIVIPDSVTSIKNAAFFRCCSLKQITIPGNVTGIGDEVFLWCSALTEIAVDVENTVYSSLDGVLYNKDKTTLLCYPAGKTNQSFTVPDGVIEIDYVAFALCENIEKITLSDDIKIVDSSAFEACESLCEIYYSGSEDDWNAIEIASGNDPLLNANIHFNYSATNIVDSGTCGENLTWTLDSEGTLTISGTGDMYDYEDEDDMPWDSDSALIKSVIIKNGVTSIGTYAFAECKNIESVSMPESMVSVDGYAFTWCDSLRSIYIPKNVENIGLVAVACAGVDFEEIIVDPENQYYTSVDGVLYNKDMTQLITYPTGKKDSVFEMPDTVVSTDPFAFSSTHYLETVIMSDKLSVLGDYSFEFCSALKNITFGDGLTALTTWQFYKCTSLESVIIPENIVKIGRMAFDGCEALTDVTILNPDCEIREVEIDGDGPIVTNRTFPKDVVMHGYENSTAQEYAEKYGCEFVSLGEYVPTKISQTVTDSQSGIQLEYSTEAYPQEVALQIEEVFDGSLYLTQQYGKIQTWNIKTCIDGEEVQPAVPVLVRLPLPDDFNADSVTVYHVNLQAGVLEQIQPVTVENGYICFMASSFSPYILVDESSIIETPDPDDPDAPNEPDDPSQNCSHLCHSDGIMGFFWKILRFFWKLFGMNPVCECGTAHY